MQSFEQLSRRGQMVRLRNLAHTALRQYPLSQYRLSVLQHEHNTTYRVRTSDGRSYVLRIHRPEQHTIEAIHSELLWLAALQQDTALKIPQPILTKDGAFFTIASADGVPEPRACALFRWLPGRFLYRQLKPSHLERVGMFTARLHEHAAKWRFPPNFVRGRIDVLTAEARRDSLLNPHNMSSAALAGNPAEEDTNRCLRLVGELFRPEDVASVTQAIQQIRLMLDSLGYSSENFGLIHADLHQENYFFDHGQVSAIDFDDCGFGHYLYDLSVTLIEIYNLPGYAAFRTALLAGYRSVRPLPAEHEAFLNTFFVLRCLQLLVWVLESREHPAFRDRWERWAGEELQYLRFWTEEK